MPLMGSCPWLTRILGVAVTREMAPLARAGALERLSLMGSLPASLPQFGLRNGDNHLTQVTLRKS